jgi:hypothetical protein
MTDHQTAAREITRSMEQLFRVIATKGCELARVQIGRAEALAEYSFRKTEEPDEHGVSDVRWFCGDFDLAHPDNICVERVLINGNFTDASPDEFADCLIEAWAHEISGRLRAAVAADALEVA